MNKPSSSKSSDSKIEQSAPMTTWIPLLLMISNNNIKFYFRTAFFENELYLIVRILLLQNSESYLMAIPPFKNFEEIIKKRFYLELPELDRRESFLVPDPDLQDVYFRNGKPIINRKIQSKYFMNNSKEFIKMLCECMNKYTYNDEIRSILSNIILIND